MAAPAFPHAARGILYPDLTARRRATRAQLAGEERKIARRAAAAGVLAAMSAGSVALWTLVPAGVLWLASRLTTTARTPSAGILLAVAVAIPTTMLLSARALVRLERVYGHITGAAARTPVVPGWRRSLSDSSALGPTSALEKIMVGSVVLAVIALATWFFAFAGSSLPT
jgi:hypothetical protein